MLLGWVGLSSRAASVGQHQDQAPFLDILGLD